MARSFNTRGENQAASARGHQRKISTLGSERLCGEKKNDEDEDGSTQ